MEGTEDYRGTFQLAFDTPDLIASPLGSNPWLPAYGLFSYILVPSSGMGGTSMALEDMARTILHTAVTAPGGLVPDTAELATAFLLLFTGPWKAFGWTDTPRWQHECEWQIPEPASVPNRRGKVKPGVLTLQHSIRVSSPMNKRYESGGEGIRLSRVVGSFAGIAAQQDSTDALNTMVMTETRVSIWLTTSFTLPQPVFRGLCLADNDSWVRGVSQRMKGSHTSRTNMDDGIRTCMWLGGIAIYQRALVAMLEVWHKEWEKLLTSVERVLSVQVSQFKFHYTMLV